MTKKIKLSISDLTKSYKIPILNDISLYVLQNEIVSIIGPSGCGKSTLLDCIAGVVDPDSGEIIINGSVHMAGSVSYMTQEDALFPWRNVLENVTLPLEIAGRRTKNAVKEVKRLLTLFGLSQFAGYFPFALSSGMRQRVALLRAYIAKKDIMLMDEPFGKLDALTRLYLQQWFLEIWKKHTLTVIFVTHDIDEALLLSDRIYVLTSRPAKVIKEFSIHRPRQPDRQHGILKRKILHLLK